MNDSLSWLRRYALPISLEGEGRTDMSGFKRGLKDVKIVGIGASSYGSKEVEQTRNTITKYLFQEMGFNALVIEAAYAPCLDINEYVTSGKHDRTSVLLKQGYWIWDNTEMADMLEWMRSYNEYREPDNKLGFYGMDIKPIRFSLDIIREYLSKASLPKSHELIEVFGQVESLDVAVGWDRKKVSSSVVYKLIGFLCLHQDKLVSISSIDEYLSVLHHARIAYRFMDAIAAENSMRQRYVYMKENLDYVLGTLDDSARVVVWGASVNLAAGTDLRPQPVNSWSDISLGSLLRNEYGTRFYNIACCLNKGYFRARQSSEDMLRIGEVQDYEFGEAPEGYIEWELAQLGEPVFALDLRSIEDRSNMPEWVRQPRFMRAFRSGFCPAWLEQESPEITHEVRLEEVYDGIAFVNHAMATTPNNRHM